jgi:VIT1/CCC1 family predicted Fe2+/Mn2+ transporter
MLAGVSVTFETRGPTAASEPAPPGAADLREIVMGTQDNLTNVLAVVLGVAIGSGDVKTVALAGLASGLAEAISMGGVLYTATRAERDVGRAVTQPGRAAVVTFLAALVAALVPLSPFLFFDLWTAVGVSIAMSVTALFCLGVWTGRVVRNSPLRDGLRFVLIGAAAAGAAALVGVVLQVD